MRAPRVLLVDDDRDSLAIYSMILEHHGLRPVRASDPDDGFRIARALGPDLVVAELFMPLVGGRPLAEALRGDARTAHLPIIGLSTLSTHVSSYASGFRACDSFLSKPCVPSRLLEEVLRFVGSVPRRAPLRAARPAAR